MIDLHLHTTASDGLSSPAELVALAAGAGLRTIAVTDHDTTASVPEVAAQAARRGLSCVPGVEVTSVHEGHDVHVLGYFLDTEAPSLVDLLQSVRAARDGRAREIAARLAEAGVPIDVDALLPAAGPSGRAIARPQIARALVAAGHVASVAEAFDRFLSEGCAAYVTHRGPTPAEAIWAIACAGGIASLAHPGTLARDQLIPGLVEAGLTALEAHHSAHDPATTARYVALAATHGLAVTGGSDFHGPGTRRSELFGVTALPPTAFSDLLERAGRVAGLLSRG
jgi:predicted metal-dependent phosphoesterase TrpH